jgi:hypothetical protein
MADPDKPKCPEAAPPSPEEPWAGREERVASYLLDRVRGKIPDPITGKPFKPKKGK